jgi:hypothetical protein
MQDNIAENMELELELPEGEVDIHEADVDDSIIDSPVLVQKEEKDELEDISNSVQKRIDKLTYKMREAERQRDEAINYAKGINQTATELKEKLKTSKEVPVQEAQNQLNLYQTRSPDPKAEQWSRNNAWFGDDQAMTFAAFGVHKELVENGVDPTSDRYYVEVDKRMRDNFPHKFSQEESAPVQQVAASSRGARGKKGVRKIKLTPSQVAIAKRLNVPIEEYAKQHAKMQGV